MHPALKIFNCRQKSEKGFVLLVALIAVMIMMAVSFLILTTSTQDISISSRLVGGRKAMSAAEAGVHQVCLSLVPTSPQVPGPQTFFDAAKDAKASFTYIAPQRNSRMPDISVPGFSNKGPVYETTVTGTESSYQSSVSIFIGTVSKPSGRDDTIYY